MKIAIHIDKVAALNAGRDQHGEVIVDVPAEALSPEQRKQLSRHSYVRDSLRNKGADFELHPTELNKAGVNVSEATPETIKAVLDQLIEHEKQQEREKAEAEAEKAARIKERVEQQLKLGVEGWINKTNGPRWSLMSHMTHGDERLLKLQSEASEIVSLHNKQVDEEHARKEQQELAEKLAWIEKHGSKRLKRLAKEGYELDAVYFDERLQTDYPGWVLAKRAYGAGDDPRNPPESALDLLDQARETAPQAQLKYWQVYEEETDQGIWRGYAAVAEFAGREIVFGLPDEYVS